jgi:hypothetical protein
MPNGNFVVVALTTRDARVWSAGVAPGAKPEMFRSVGAHADHKHVRAAQGAHLHHRKIDDPVFFGAVADAISGAGSILLMGHGKGKANAMLSFVQYLERKHPLIAARVDGAVDHDLESMTEGQVLAAAREWHEHHVAMT